MTHVRLTEVSHRFGKTAALDDVSLEIAAGELFLLLGPSGCGKSTALRVIAGLMTPSSGQIFFNDRDVTDVPTQQRNAVMCFQSYALWPHMTVRQNIEFGLGVKGINGSRRPERLVETLKLMRMEDLADRLPGQLSGGQQQRVALARALAVRPDCLLLDEPLSNLDAALRLEMRGEIRRICKSAGCTAIYVTHDQKEALAIADRLAILDRGKVVQTGTPSECYSRPRNSFVAAFLGQTNLIPGKITARHGQTVQVQTAVGDIWATAQSTLPDAVTVSIRPERIRLASSPREGVNRIAVRIVQSTFLGESSEHVLLAGGRQILMSAAPPAANVPQEAFVEFDTQDALALPD